MPSEYMSLRPSTGLPVACSGDMNRGVPTTAPASVRASSPSTRRDTPKSITLSVPPGVTIRLLGLMSRCTMPTRSAA
jgi:hypothetical protein